MNRVAFFGYNDTGYAVLKGLVMAGADIIAIIIPAEVEKYRTDMFHALAIEKEIRVFQQNKRLEVECMEYLKAMEVSWFVVASYPYIIDVDGIEVLGLKAINIHGGMLPKYRGANALNWAIANGETEMGLTVHQLTMGIDQGDILYEDTITIDKYDDAGLVRRKLINAAEQVIVKIWPLIDDFYAEAVPQEEAQANYFRKRTHKDSELYFQFNDARRIVNLVRAVASPYPNAFICYKDIKYFVPNAVEISDIGSKSESGKILRSERWSIDISTGGGIVKLYNLYDSNGAIDCLETFKVGDTLT